MSWWWFKIVNEFHMVYFFFKKKYCCLAKYAWRIINQIYCSNSCKELFSLMFVWIWSLAILLFLLLNFDSVIYVSWMPIILDAGLLLRCWHCIVVCLLIVTVCPCVVCLPCSHCERPRVRDSFMRQFQLLSVNISYYKWSIFVPGNSVCFFVD